MQHFGILSKKINSKYHQQHTRCDFNQYSYFKERYSNYIYFLFLVGVTCWDTIMCLLIAWKTAVEFPLLLSYTQNRQSPIWFSATCTIITLVLNFNMLNHFTPTEHWLEWPNGNWHIIMKFISVPQDSHNFPCKNQLFKAARNMLKIQQTFCG